MATIANLAVNITARTRGYGRGIDRARKQTHTFTAAITSATRKVVGYGSALLAVAAGGGMGVLVQRQFSAIDSTAKLADRIGIATERLAGLRTAAVRAGMSSTQLDSSLDRLNRRIGDAIMGGGEATKAFEQLGLSGESLSGMPLDQVVARIAERFADVEGQAAKAALAQQMFGRSGLEMINMLQQGSASLEEAQQQAERFGTALSRTDAAKIEMANDALADVRDVIVGIAQQAAVQLAPIIEAVASKLVDVAAAGSKMQDVVSRAFEAAIDIGAKLLDWVVDPLVFGLRLAQLATTQFAALTVDGIAKILDLAARLPDWLGGGVASNAAEFAHEFASALDEAVQDIQARMNESLLGPSMGNRLKAWTRNVKSAADDAAKHVAATHEALAGIGRFADTGMGDGGTGSGVAFEQIVRSRTVIGGASQRRGQQVEDPQLRQTNDLLSRMYDQMTKGIPAALT